MKDSILLDKRSHSSWVLLWLASLFPSATVLVLLGMGQDWWCPAGDFALWSSEIASIHNSQHLMDPYGFTHVLHGVAFYGLMWGLFRDRWNGSQRALGALALEGLWEVFENTPLVIERYRTETISLGYSGDSVVNSLGDISACMLGYAMAGVLPWRGSLGLILGVEGFLLWWIRDSLLLNVVMLVWPIQAVKVWQAGGMG